MLCSTVNYLSSVYVRKHPFQSSVVCCFEMFGSHALMGKSKLKFMPKSLFSEISFNVLKNDAVGSALSPNNSTLRFDATCQVRS